MSAYTKFPGTFSRVWGTDRYTASEDLVWHVGYPESVTVVTVPALYEHDVSIPWALTWLVSRHDPRFQRAARLHDWLLDLGWGAWTSAGIFYDALKADNVPRAVRWGMAMSVLSYISSKQKDT